MMSRENGRLILNCLFVEGRTRAAIKVELFRATADDEDFVGRGEISKIDDETFRFTRIEIDALNGLRLIPRRRDRYRVRPADAQAAFEEGAGAGC